jgi:hypothetical protein
VTAVRTFDAQISAHERLAHIDVFDLYLDLVLLAIGRLASLEATTGAEERRRAIGNKLYSESAQVVPIPPSYIARCTHSARRKWRGQVAAEERCRAGRSRGER